MPRLFQFAIFGFLAYAVVTATPAKQADIARGGLAIKDAAVVACQRDGSFCVRAIGYLTSAFARHMRETDAPWLDDQSKRTAHAQPKS